MDATTFLMNCYGIPQSLRDEFEETLKTTSLDNLDLSFRMMSQQSDDDDYDAKLDTWPLRIEFCATKA